MTDTLQAMIAELRESVSQSSPNTRTMHRVMSAYRSGDKEVLKAITAIVEDFDEKFSEGEEELAVDSMDKMIGLLEGELISKTSITSETEKIDLLPHFALSKLEKSRVLELCSDMRKIVYASDVFDHPHKIRIANRIAAIEAEVHKAKGLFDVILGGVADIGESLRRFGRDIKPLTDRISEVRQITQKNTPEYSQIPPPDDIKRIEDRTKGSGD